MEECRSKLKSKGKFEILRTFFLSRDMNMCCNVEADEAQTENMNKLRELKAECAKEVFGNLYLLHFL